MFRTPPAIAIGLALAACGSPAAPVAAPAGPAPLEPASDLSLERDESEPLAVDARVPVQTGAYRLLMTASCPQQERTAKGRLTLKRISLAELPGGSGESIQGSERLLWGQTDLDVENLEACPGPSPARPAKREPIHPSLLVEVLQWNGHSQRQVLLVSSDPGAGKGRRGSGAGVAMWVERADQGHLAGVWCRWEDMNAGEGRWEADLLRADSP